MTQWLRFKRWLFQLQFLNNNDLPITNAVIIIKNFNSRKKRTIISSPLLIRFIGLSSLQGGSLEITRTVPLFTRVNKIKFIILYVLAWEPSFAWQLKFLLNANLENKTKLRTFLCFFRVPQLKLKGVFAKNKRGIGSMR